MVLPGLAGYWLDLRLGTKVVFMLVGFAVGMFVAMKHLLRSTKEAAKKEAAKKDSEIKEAAIEKSAIKKSSMDKPDRAKDSDR